MSKDNTRIKKLKEKIANTERLYDRSMRMAKKYSDKLYGMNHLLYKLKSQQ
jgi:hypothetical protein